jgi:hypothetical protein
VPNQARGDVFGNAVGDRDGLDQGHELLGVHHGGVGRVKRIPIKKISKVDFLEYLLKKVSIESTFEKEHDTALSPSHRGAHAPTFE